MNYDKFDALILAGGHSRRMGTPKAWLPFNGQSALEHLTNKFLDAGANRVAVVLNRKHSSKEERMKFLLDNENVILVENCQVDRGRWYSIVIGTKELINENYLFIQNVDCPLVRGGTYRNLFQNKLVKGVTKPRFNGKKGHPVLISPDIKIQILEAQRNDWILRDFLSNFESKFIDTDDEHILKNINTVNDYERVNNGSAS